MPGKGTTRRTIRVDDDLWERAGAAVGEDGRGEAIRQFLRWLVGDTETLPDRPADHS
ncbi:hypothetical protein ACWGN5_07620 [Streptomyces sp. NPDC055815]